jgi:hypothetical protein
MEGNGEYTVLMLVEAETPQLARESAVGELMSKVVAERFTLNGFSLSYLVPAKATSAEGHALIEQVWLEYMKQNVADLQIVMHELAPHMTDEEPPLGVLDDWGVRAACLRLGTISSWPIRIYHMGIGVNNTSMLGELMNDDSLWVVSAQVS